MFNDYGIYASKEDLVGLVKRYDSNVFFIITLEFIKVGWESFVFGVCKWDDIENAHKIMITRKRKIQFSIINLICFKKQSLKNSKKKLYFLNKFNKRKTWKLSKN